MNSVFIEFGVCSTPRKQWMGFRMTWLRLVEMKWGLRLGNEARIRGALSMSRYHSGGEDQSAVGSLSWQAALGTRDRKQVQAAGCRLSGAETYHVVGRRQPALPSPGLWLVVVRDGRQVGFPGQRLYDCTMDCSWEQRAGGSPEKRNAERYWTVNKVNTIWLWVSVCETSTVYTEIISGGEQARAF